MNGGLLQISKYRLVCAGILLALITMSGCATSGGSISKEDADGGVSLGEMASREAGPGSKNAVVSNTVGSGVPYILGNSVDEHKATQLLKASPSRNYATHSEVYPLGGTKWRVTGIKPEGRLAAYKNVVLEFQADGRLITTADRLDRKTIRNDECYRVIGNTLAVSRGGYIANYAYKMQSNQLTASSGGITITAEKAK